MFRWYLGMCMDQRGQVQSRTQNPTYPFQVMRLGSQSGEVINILVLEPSIHYDHATLHHLPLIRRLLPWVAHLVQLARLGYAWDLRLWEIDWTWIVKVKSDKSFSISGFRLPSYSTHAHHRQRQSHQLRMYRCSVLDSVQIEWLVARFENLIHSEQLFSQVPSRCWRVTAWMARQPW